MAVVCTTPKQHWWKSKVFNWFLIKWFFKICEKNFGVPYVVESFQKKKKKLINKIFNWRRCNKIEDFRSVLIWRIFGFEYYNITSHHIASQWERVEDKNEEKIFFLHPSFLLNLNWYDDSFFLFMFPIWSFTDDAIVCWIKTSL